ncbi:hypothetical protein [Corynebacterium coyleae]|uniref:hypothetical protein n=1 Tax=Corynebacterium coyleae TaxID=53374 RepID=UPI0011AE241A|nr:hypothetical protein [Corynebacterium coyleae]
MLCDDPTPQQQLAHRLILTEDIETREEVVEAFGEGRVGLIERRGEQERRLLGEKIAIRGEDGGAAFRYSTSTLVAGVLKMTSRSSVTFMGTFRDSGEDGQHRV